MFPIQECEELRVPFVHSEAKRSISPSDSDIVHGCTAIITDMLKAFPMTSLSIGEWSEGRYHMQCRCGPYKPHRMAEKGAQRVCANQISSKGKRRICRFLRRTALCIVGPGSALRSTRSNLFDERRTDDTSSAAVTTQPLVRLTCGLWYRTATGEVGLHWLTISSSAVRCFARPDYACRKKSQ